MAGQPVRIVNAEVGEALNGGVKTVTTAGTRVALVSASTACKEVLIQAIRTNTGRIYLGGAAVANNDTNGVYLTAGQTIQLTPQNLNQIYIDSTVNGEGVTYIYW